MNNIKSTTTISPYGKMEICSQINAIEKYDLVLGDSVPNAGKYTLHMWIKKINNDSNANISITIGQIVKTYQIMNSWNYICFTFETTQPEDIIFNLSSNEYYIYNIKLERGQKDTDYSPSFNDKQDKIQIKGIVKSDENGKLSAAMPSDINAAKDANGNIIIDTYATKIELAAANLRIDTIIANSTDGIHMTSPNGTNYVLTVDDNGNLVTNAVN